MTETTRDNDLLSDPIFSVTLRDGSARDLSLPDVLEHLGAGDISSFGGLRAHQQQAWHTFLAQLGALCLEQAGASDPKQASPWWREQLLALASGVEQAWWLVVEDAAKPAFMQTSVLEGSLERGKYKDASVFADAYDMLVTAKNHDVKQDLMRAPSSEHWVYALVTLQTMEGFLGRGNYGIARMNGGFASRPYASLADDQTIGNRWARDVRVALVEAAKQVKAGEFGYTASGHKLLWCEPWGGTKSESLGPRALHPLFVEVCRRVRIKPIEGCRVCVRSNTVASRLAFPKELNGVTGDAWTPTVHDRRGARALTMGAAGFSYTFVHRLLFDPEVRQCASLEVTRDDASRVYLVLQVLARGQGITEGLHERVIEAPGHIASRLFGPPDQLAALAQLSNALLEDVEVVSRKALIPAIGRLHAPEGEQSDFDKIAPWLTRFDQRIDEHYFHSLWELAELPREEAKNLWRERLIGWGRAVLEQAIASSPIPQARYWRRVSAADSIYEGSLRNRFAEYYESRHV